MTYLHSLGARVRLSWRLLLKELGAFGIVGAACFVLDLGIFQLLYAHAGLGAVSSKLISTVVSMTVAFYAHRFWSFSHRARTGLKREYTIFFVVNGLTMLLALVVVAAIRYPFGQDSTLVLQVGNVVSTVLGTVIRYLCYRAWVFVRADAPAAIAHRQHAQQRAVLQNAA